MKIRFLLVILAIFTFSMVKSQVQNYYSVSVGNGYGFRFAGGDNNYSIVLGTGTPYRYGPITDYSVKFNMNNDTDNGWTWGVYGAVPVAALNTEGTLQLKKDLRVLGNVGIGTTSTAGAALTVQGSIKVGNIELDSDLSLNGILNAGKIRLFNDVPSSDYVFSDSYKLISFGELNAFIQENKHLPDVPSAEEFKQEGYSVGEMDDLLLRKVEELTLYILELEQKINSLESKLQLE